MRQGVRELRPAPLAARRRAAAAGASARRWAARRAPSRRRAARPRTRRGSSGSGCVVAKRTRTSPPSIGARRSSGVLAMASLPCGDDERDGERDLEARLVEAGERAARVDGLELRERVGDARLLRLEEPLVPAHERRVVLDVDAAVPGGPRARARARPRPWSSSSLHVGRDGRAAAGVTLADVTCRPRACSQMLWRAGRARRRCRPCRRSPRARAGCQLDGLGRRVHVAREAQARARLVALAVGGAEPPRRTPLRDGARRKRASREQHTPPGHTR